MNIIGTAPDGEHRMAHARAELLKLLSTSHFRSRVGGDGFPQIVTAFCSSSKRDHLFSLLYKSLKFSVTPFDDASIDTVVPALVELNIDSDTDDLLGLLSSIKFFTRNDAGSSV